jgi:DnaB-like helicase N terminal domain
MRLSAGKSISSVLRLTFARCAAGDARAKMRDSMNTPVLPHSTQAEKSVLGSILIEQALKGPTIELTEDDFYSPQHKKIFKTFRDLHELGQPIEFEGISSRLNGQTAYLAEIVTGVNTTANLALHVKQLKEAALKRRLYSFVLSFKSKLDATPAEELTEDLQNFAKSLDITGQSHREINLTREIEKWVAVTEGNFSVTDCYNELQGVTRVTKRNNYRVILNRLKGRGIIQSSGNKDGVFRRVDDHDEEIEWWRAEDRPLPFVCPLGSHKFVSLYQRNVGIVAGEPNAGKTAYLLNLAVMSVKHFERVRYFSSEMGEVELKTRISKFTNIPESEWRKIKFICRAGNFADRIDPDGFNLIDFLEITDDFYRIAALIKEIYDKLNKGVCFIGIQKNKGTDFGRGGQLGLEKPRLYMSMEPGKIKIVKAKAWAQEGKNPNGLQKEFKLVQGARFIEDSPWHRDGEAW